MISPSSRSAIGPPTAASGETCPIAAPLDAPLKRPSVISATVDPRPVSYTHLINHGVSVFISALITHDIDIDILFCQKTGELSQHLWLIPVKDSDSTASLSLIHI